MMLTIPMFTNVTNYGDERTRNLILSIQACWKPYFPKASLYVTESSKPKPRFFLKMEVYVLTGFEIPCCSSISKLYIY